MTEQTKIAGCTGRCADCKTWGQIPADARAIAGWRLVVSASIAFLLPTGLAMAAAFALREPAHQALAAVGGLAAGALLTRVITAFIKPKVHHT